MLCSPKRQTSLRVISLLRRSPLSLTSLYTRGSEDSRRSFAAAAAAEVDMASASAAYSGCGSDRWYDSSRRREKLPAISRHFHKVRGCFEAEHSRNSRRSLHSNSKASRRSGGFDHHKAQFVRDLELNGISLSVDEPFRRGNLLGFPNHTLPHEKVSVAVDVDEVLGNFVSALNRFIADRYSLNHSVSEYHVYEFFKIWNCSRDEADIRVHEFFTTPYFKTGIHPIPGAQKALHKLSQFCDLSVVTSRQNAIKDHTIEWIEKHYPGLFKEIHFGNHFALDGESKPKSDICRSLGARVLIDDNPRYAIECAEVGIRVLLFDYENSYPWCKTNSINHHPLVTRVHNWEEVEEQLNSWILH